MTAALQRDNAFWQFSLEIYGAPGVAAECLAPQDTLGIDVNLLLFCAWLGAARRIALTASEVESALNLVQPWHDQAVRPLRAVRKQLKEFSTPDGEAFRTRVKALELEAEQVEQAMLFSYALQIWPRIGTDEPRDAVAANLRTYLQSKRHDGAAYSVQRLVDAAIQSGGSKARVAPGP
jgi:uncharacterized protein (TIGR02444 family)